MSKEFVRYRPDVEQMEPDFERTLQAVLDDGQKIESLEIIVDNEQGLIVERTIALRPFPAVKLFRDAMYASLKDRLPPDVWDYPTS